MGQDASLLSIQKFGQIILDIFVSDATHALSVLASGKARYDYCFRASAFADNQCLAVVENLLLHLGL